MSANPPSSATSGYINIYVSCRPTKYISYLHISHLNLPSRNFSKSIMSSFVKSKKSPDVHQSLPAESPLKPLSELSVIAPGISHMGGYLNTGRSINFHAYKDEPPLFNLDISSGLGVLRAGSLTKGRGIAWRRDGEKKGEFDVVLGDDRMKSKMEKLSKDDYRWTISSPQWALKGAAIDEEATLCEVEKTFEWTRSPRIEGIQPGFGNPDWKLADRSTGEAHAVFVERWDGSSDRGKIQFRRSWGSEWEMGVLVTVGAIEEIERCRKNSGSFSWGFF